MMIYAYISAIMDGVGGLALRLIGLHITPHFDKPFLSTSVKDFWGRRWNLVGGSSLRMLVRFKSYPLWTNDSTAHACRQSLRLPCHPCVGQDPSWNAWNIPAFLLRVSM